MATMDQYDRIEAINDLTDERDRLRGALEAARSCLLAIRDPFWVPPNVVEEIDRHLAAIEAVLGEQS